MAGCHARRHVYRQAGTILFTGWNRIPFSNDMRFWRPASNRAVFLPMIINCATYQDGKRVADIRTEDIPAALKDPDLFTWVALKDPEPAEILMMQELFDLPELAVEDTLHGNQRPKVEEYDHLLFTSMKVAEQYDGEIHYGDMYVFINRHFVLSIRNGVRRSFSDVRLRAEKETELLRLGPVFVLYALTDAVVDRFMPIVDGLESQLERIEAEIFHEQPTREMMLRLHSMKQDVTELRHAVPAVRDELFLRLGGTRTYSMRSATVQDYSMQGTGLQDYFRDVHDHLQRINQSLDGVRDGILMAMQVNMSLISLEQSEVSKKLAAWAAIFAMMTTLAGIWGMNFENMPELKWPMGYPVALLLMAAIGLILFRRFRKVGWL